LSASDSTGGAAKPLVDLEQLRSACDGNAQLMRQLMDLYFGQADEVMAGLEKAIQAGDIGEVDHLSHKLAGSSLGCGMSAIVGPLRQLEQGAKKGHLLGAAEWLTQAKAQLELLRRYIQDLIRQNPPSGGMG
jgi:HPt (histidine-containing phosphotransfer) domain-containing protein